jgi:flagellar assembly factor FliW
MLDTELSNSELNNVIEFVSPILGFEGETSFTLSPLEATGTLWALSSTRTPELSFVLAPPQPFFPDYAPDLDEGTLDALDARGEALTVLVIVSVSGSIRTATANLLAPVVLAPDRHRGLQVVLADDSLSLRAPLVPNSAG